MNALDERAIPWMLWAAGVVAVWWAGNVIAAAVAGLTFGWALLAALKIGELRGRDEAEASKRRRR